jgi:hypothetical protein
MPNELSLDLFEFLNPRFDALLFVHFPTYNVDFQSVSNRDFDIMCGQHLPSIIDRVISLRLRDENNGLDIFASFEINCTIGIISFF